MFVDTNTFSEWSPVEARHMIRAYAYQMQVVSFKKSYSEEGFYWLRVSVTDPITSVPYVKSRIKVVRPFQIYCPSWVIIGRQFTCFVTQPSGINIVFKSIACKSHENLTYHHIKNVLAECKNFILGNFFVI